MNSLKFEGKGFAFFKIHFINVILTLLSLTILYPWAKIRELKYSLQNTYLSESPFIFSGKTSTFFKGYIKTLLVILICFLICIAGGFLTGLFKTSIFSTFIYTLTFIIALAYIYYFLPIILHGSLNYRFDNTTWNDIKPSYTGKLSKLVPAYFTGTILTSLTFGLYKAWFQVKITRYLLRNFRFGSLRFDFSGEAKNLFLIYLKGFFLSLITFGIYGIWVAKQVYEYFVNNIVVKKGDHEFKLHSDANSLEVFEMMVGNFLLIFLTFGIGASWAYMRFYRFIINHCVIPADFNISSINDTVEPETEYSSAKNWLDKWNPVLIA